ncbi:nitrogenase iron-molybdenum cofactor biosynthesis protein NifE [Herbivorax sp. ANBcel31]|uniref:nitrogenase iron-molybdenum cofactor biosynthesis protein NifE n=1 Tax=Herbivorax sp. ANBcel31 TaxID=3069754 RepID=UPI0027B36C0C|nr:nitrogenase iron-molybdenum cofactor biosynthesis protein NifE [Herbivorax sp. ANBcel31]MDQ2087105.1 nitrogenase iron-molybdenum cofactor biosynthesis protein NifE [Herbivorax sp. ANBcel31]
MAKGNDILKDRKEFICYKSQKEEGSIKCEKDSVAGSVSQRACVYCGARVVLNPITDAFHIVHGPIGCAAYTWDIRGSLSSGSEIYRNSFSTDLREHDVVFGGEKKLTGAIDEIVDKYKPKLIFVYATCIVGVIGDDIDAVCKMAEKKYGIRVIPVKSSGFAGNKSMGYRAAGKALLKLMGDDLPEKEKGINFLGDFNLAGEMWIITGYLRSIGINVIAKITGDSTYKEILEAPKASFNIVQCAGSMTSLAKEMEKKYNIPFVKVSFFGFEDTCTSILTIAQRYGDKEMIKRAEKLINSEKAKYGLKISALRERLKGKKAAIYVGGGFKAISLIKQFNDLGIKSVVVGTQTGRKDEYEVLKSISDEGTVILDDTNPAELEKFIKEKEADLLVGGVKERPLAYKLGLAFCDHNHERKHPLCGFEGALNFAKELDLTVNSPVWEFVKSS